MKDFTYINNKFNLHAYSCEWLRDMGLKETRWILDTEWILSYYNDLTYNKWIGE